MLLSMLMVVSAAATDAVPCEILFRPHDVKQIEAIVHDHALTVLRVLPRIEWVRARHPCSEAQRHEPLVTRVQRLRDVAEKLAGDRRVRSAQPNWVPQLRLPNDPVFRQQWALHNVGQGNWPVDNDVNGPEAWTMATGAGVTVAVIDSGVRHQHEDLYDQIAVNAAEFENGRDDDGNGYVDDVIGWDFIDDDNDPDDPLPDYDRAAGAEVAHGTGVAGLIAAATNNGLGVAGMAPDARVLALRAIGDDSGVATIAEAIVYASDAGARVQNHSWGTGSVSSRIDADAFTYAAAHGAVLVIAAGNDNRNLDAVGEDDFPTELDNDAIISVGAMSRGDFLLSFSNHGPLAVDVAAPGGAGLFTTSNIFSGGIGASGNYSRMEGTSFSAPMVAGVVALMLELDPGLDARRIREILIASSDASRVDVGGTFGGGYVRADRALQMVLGAPAPPRSRIDAPWLEARNWVVNVGATVHLRARVVDPDSLTLEHRWQVTGPPGSTAFVQPHTVEPRFVADRCGGYEILHFVSDGQHETALERRWLYAGFQQALDLQTDQVCATGLCGYRSDDDFEFDVDGNGSFAVHLKSTDADAVGGFVTIDADRRTIFTNQGKGGTAWTAPFAGPATVTVSVFSSFEVRRPAVIDALFFCGDSCPVGSFDCDDNDSNGCETTVPCVVDNVVEGEGEGEGEGGEGEGGEGEGEGEGGEGEGEGGEGEREGGEGEGGEEGDGEEGDGEGRDSDPRSRPRTTEVVRSCNAADETPWLLTLLLFVGRSPRRRR